MLTLNGCLVAQSLRDPTLLNQLHVYRATISPDGLKINAQGQRGRWNLYWVRCAPADVQTIQAQLEPGWYAHFWSGDRITVVYADRSFTIVSHDRSTWADAIAHGRRHGIPDEQLDFVVDDAALPHPGVAWREFALAAPELAAAGQKLLYQYGIGLGYLGTVRRDGGPRLHPFCPILTSGGLFGLIASSPKQRDLLRDGRYAIHSFPLQDRDDEFYLTGRGVHRNDRALAADVRAAFLATGGHSSNDELLFEFAIEHVLLATYKPRGEPDTWPPTYAKWHAAEAPAQPGKRSLP